MVRSFAPKYAVPMEMRVVQLSSRSWTTLREGHSREMPCKHCISGPESLQMFRWDARFAIRERMEAAQVSIVTWAVSERRVL